MSGRRASTLTQFRVEGELRLDEAADAVVGAKVRIEVGHVAKTFLHSITGLKGKGISRKQRTRWQHLSRLKASVFFSLQ